MAMQAQKEVLILQIYEAFQDVRPPANNFGIYSAEAADDYRSPTAEEKLLDRQLSKMPVTIKDMHACPAALSHLKPDGYHFYLPAFMVLSLRYEDDPAYNGYAYMDSPEYSLYSPSKGLETYGEERHSRFNEAQVKAAIAYLEYRIMRCNFTKADAAVEYWQERLLRL